MRATTATRASRIGANIENHDLRFTESWTVGERTRLVWGCGVGRCGARLGDTRASRQRQQALRRASVSPVRDSRRGALPTRTLWRRRRPAMASAHVGASEIRRLTRRCAAPASRAASTRATAATAALIIRAAPPPRAPSTASSPREPSSPTGSSSPCRKGCRARIYCDPHAPPSPHGIVVLKTTCQIGQRSARVRHAFGGRWGRTPTRITKGEACGRSREWTKTIRHSKR